MNEHTQGLAEGEVMMSKMNLQQSDGMGRAWGWKGRAHGSNMVDMVACLAASVTRSAVFSGDLTADRSSRLNSGVFR